MGYDMFMIQLATPPVLLVLSAAGSSSSSCGVLIMQASAYLSGAKRYHMTLKPTLDWLI